jgi:hypothetical protein
MALFCKTEQSILGKNRQDFILFISKFKPILDYKLVRYYVNYCRI